MRNLALKFRQLKLRPIPTALAVCFFLLLLLILISGGLGQSNLEEIRLRSDESTRAYTNRLELAIKIREAASDTVARARLYRAAKNLGFPGPVYRVNLNTAKVRLEKLLDRGKKLWAANEQSLPPAEIGAWRRLESATEEFWKVIEKEERDQAEKSDPGTQAPAETSNVSKEVAPASDSTNNTGSNAGSNTGNNTSNNTGNNLGEEFFQRRTNLEVAADELSNSINSGLQKSRDDLDKLKNKAALLFSSANWFTLGMGIAVIVITILLTRGYINQVKQEERLKQEAQGRLRSVFDSLSDDIVVLGEQGEVLDVNQAFLKHYKLTDEELKLQDYRAALAQMPEIASFVGKTLVSNEIDQRQRERIEVKSNNGHQNSTLFDVSVSPLKVGDNTNGRVVVMDDVTDDERVREELRRSRTLSAVGQITAQVAHEIYNPLGAVKLNLELIEMQVNDDEDVRHTIGRLKRGVEHLSTIVMDLRYLTRPREPERKPTDLNHLLDEIIELASDRLERSRICVVRDYSEEAPQGEFDPQQLRKVFLNLLINAVEASPQSGEVKLRTRIISKQEASAIPDFNSPHGAIAVSVIDHGVGMSAETKRRIFEAFYTTKRNGTGLGMMITQEIVKKHGGKIEVESEEKKGTTVSVYLPI